MCACESVCACECVCEYLYITPKHKQKAFTLTSRERETGFLDNGGDLHHTE